MEVNRLQRHFMVEKIRQALGQALAGKVIAVLGLTFKPNTDDMRDAPSLAILPPLIADGATVRAFDPAGMEPARSLMPEVVYCDNAYHAAQGAHVLVIMTEWNQFRNLDFARLKAAMQDRVVVDLRNVYPPQLVREEGFTYFSVGRP